MEYKLYKLSFQTAVHFGSGTLESAEAAFCADTLFSALCQEAYRQSPDWMVQLYKYACEDKLRLSDAFPYDGDTYFLPKPMTKIEGEQRESSSVIKKAYKKLKYIPVQAFDEYLQGKFDVLRAGQSRPFGISESRATVSIRGTEKTEPYRIGIYTFFEGNGLYFIVGYESNEAVLLMEDLLKRLTYSGLGGKRTAGYGRFKFKTNKLPSQLESRMEREGHKYMSLSVSLPRKEEMERVMTDAEYILCRRSGFVASETYAAEQMRKKDIYVFKAGSCFSKKFRGDVYDVSCKGGKHAVYRYAKPLFMEVDV